MSGQTLNKAFVPLPGGLTAVYTSAGLSYYRHPDWLGSSRLATTPSRTMYSSVAYAPFGEPYSQAGVNDLSFTGQNADTTSDLYDFMFRRYHPTQGRWIAPDPAGLDAVDPTNPQTWNRYAYVGNNPLAFIDPLGLFRRDDCPGGCVDGWYPLLGFEGCYVYTTYREIQDDSGHSWATPTFVSLRCGQGNGRSGGGGSASGKRSKPANNGKKSCIPRKSLSFTTRTTLSVLSWAAKRSGGLRAIGIGGAGAYAPPSLAGGGGSVQALWMADYLGQQGLYWSISGGPTVGEKGAGAVGGIQYMTSTFNTNVTVQDVVNSSFSGGVAHPFWQS